jgi:hypothetical protein
MPDPEPLPIARGSPLIRSNADLDALAAIAPADVAAARRYWRRRAPAKFKGLLDSKKKKDVD